MAMATDGWLWHCRARVRNVRSVTIYAGAVGGRNHGREQAISGLLRALHHQSLRRLAPVWLCVNTIVGLWLGPTLIFLLTRNSQTNQCRCRVVSIMG